MRRSWRGWGCLNTDYRCPADGGPVYQRAVASCAGRGITDRVADSSQADRYC